MDADVVETLCAAEDSEDDQIEMATWFQQQSALNGSSCDFDESAVGWNESESSRHVLVIDGVSLTFLAKRVEPLLGELGSGLS